MTVASTANRITFAGNGVTTSFATSPVVFYDTSDLVVYAVTVATGVSQTLVEGTNYTVVGGAGLVGTVDTSLGASPYGAPASGVTLVIVRTLPLVQEADPQNNDNSDANVIETALDKLTMMCQQVSNAIGRVLRLSDSDVSGASLVVPSPVASTILGWNASANALENKVPANINLATVTAFIATLLDDADAATARATLGTRIGTDVQAFDADLSAIAALTSAANKMPYATAAQTWALADLTAFARTLLDDADAATMRSTLGIASGITQGASAATTAGASIDFTGIPAGTKRIVFSWSGGSTTGTSAPMIQARVAGAAVTSGYLAGDTNASGSSVGNGTTGAKVSTTIAAASILHGWFMFVLVDATTNRWVWFGGFGFSNAADIGMCAGSITLAGAIDGLRLTTVGGADTFDAGLANIQYES